MENREYKVAFVEDMLFDLAINKTLALYPEKHIIDEDREWFNVAIREVEVRVKESLEFLLSIDCDTPHYEPLCFTLMNAHKLHRASLPPRIEKALIALVCDKWAADNGLKIKEIGDEAIATLRSVALKSSTKPYRRYDI